MPKSVVGRCLFWFFFNPLWIVIAALYWHKSEELGSMNGEKEFLIKAIEKDREFYREQDERFGK